MALVTLTRQEWVAIAEELDAGHRHDAPPGLRERIAALLADTPAAWPEQACKLELADLAAVDLVYSIVHQGRSEPVDSGFQWQEQASIAEAERIIREHQHRKDEE